MTTLDQLLHQTVEQIFPSKAALAKRLKHGPKLKVYQGFDPTSPDLHLGHTIGLRKLRQFQDLGHQVIFLFGDFTATIGDPTGKSQARNRLTAKQVRQNTAKYLRQAGKIVKFTGPNPALVKYNSTWLKPLTFARLIDLASHFTLQQMIERDMFQTRIKKHQPIYLHEFFYPLMQAYDSVEMDVDLEIGGTDQTFNMLAGRSLMKALRGKDKFVMTLKLLTDGRGHKMGKSEGNAIALDLPPSQMYGQIMALPDEIIIPLFELATDLPAADLTQLQTDLKLGTNPMAAKKRLAHTIVACYHSTKAADQAQTEFEHIFQQRQAPSPVREFSLSNTDGPPTLVNILTAAGLTNSKSQAKRLISAGTVSLNQQKVTDPTYSVTHLPTTLQVGKKKTTLKIIK